MSRIEKNVLFIAYYFPPAGGSALPGSQRTVKFLRYLTEFSSNVLSLAPDYYREYIDLNFEVELPIKGEQVFRTRNFDFFQILLKIRSGAKTLFCKRPSTYISVDALQLSKGERSECSNRTLFQRLKDLIYEFNYFPDDAGPWLFPALWRGRKIIKAQNIDLIFATGMPWTSLVVAYFLHKLTKKPLIVDFRDPWVGNPFHVSKGTFIDKLMVSLESRIVKSATYVSANTAPLRDDFLKRYPSENPDKFVVLPNGYDSFDFSDYTALSASGDVLKIAHAGSLYGKRSPVSMINSLSSLLIDQSASVNNWHFLQMGYVEPEYSFHSNYGDLCESGMIEDAGLLPYDVCLKRLAESDVAVLIQPGTKIQVPSKLYDYIAMGKYIIALTPLDGILAEMMREYNLGDVFDPDDTLGISNKLKELCAIKKQDGKLTVSYKDIEKFDVKHITAQLEDLFLKATS